MLAPVKFRSRPLVSTIDDEDIFPLSRMVEGTAITYSIRWGDMSEQIVAEIDEARQEIVDGFAAVQTDLAAQLAWAQSEIDALETGKANASHTHAISDVTGLSAALSGKEPTISAGTTSQYWRGDKTWQTLNKAAVGLGNVDNTSDASKPISTLVQAALDGKLGLPSISVPSRTIGTAFQPNATKWVVGIYSVKTQVTNPLLVGTSTATVVLQSDASNPPTTERSRAESSSGVGLTVTVALTTSNTSIVFAFIPPGHYARLQQTITGTGAASIVSQAEITFG